MVDDALPVVTISLEEEGKSGKELPGGTMELHTTSGADLSKVEKISGPDIKYDPEKNVISWESGDEQLELVGLPEGSYEIIEKDAPSGYEKSEKIPFKVKEDGEVKSVPGSAGKVDPETNLVQMYNKEPEKKPTEITISLEEEGKSGKELPGGTMELHTTSGADLSKVEKISGPDIKYDPEKNVISWESGDEQLKLKDLPEGSYEIIEKDAPSGYEKSEKIPFEVKEDGEVKSVPGSAGKVDPETNLVSLSLRITTSRL